MTYFIISPNPGCQSPGLSPHSQLQTILPWENTQLMAHARHRKCWGKSDELMRGYFNPTLHPLPCPSSFLTNIKMLQIHPCFPDGSDGKESACNAGDPGSIPGLGRSPAEGNGHPIQYSYLENSMDRRACRATVYWVTKSWTLLSNYHFHPYFKATTNIHSTLHLPPTTILTLWLQSSPLEKWSPLVHFTLTLCSFLRPGSRSWPQPTKATNKLLEQNTKNTS